ncbi:MAG TPA: GNAT family N-acetyltransferase [Longimicrobium sp.]|nr:GNAT family N-acetyltransferase [Longimicrobium sp.]
MQLEAPPHLATEAIVSGEALNALRGEWSALWERSAATPFQSPEWLLAWWRHFGGAGLRALAVRREGELIGLAPLFVHGFPDGTRQVTPVGNGLSDHVDLLAARGREGEVADAALGWLAEHTDEWDTADFRDLPAGSALLGAPLPDGIAAAEEEEVPAPALRLASALEDAVPSAFLKKLRYYRRRLEREHTVETVRADGDNWRPLFDALVALHSARWLRRGERGMFDDRATRLFHREVIAAFAARGWLRMYALLLDGRIVAVHYGFAAKGRAYYYLGGFDPAFERLSVGTVLVGHAIEEAAREGCREMDFLRGREPYKYAWGAIDRSQRRLRLRSAR